MIWLLRHGDAEDQSAEGDDASRQLTETGRRQAENAGKALAALGVKLDACLTSPRVRAWDTAEIACKEFRELDLEVERTDVLRGGDFDLEELAAGRGEVMLVGHEPDFSRAIQAGTGARIKLKKGGLAGVEDGLLHVLLRPSDLKLIAN